MWEYDSDGYDEDGYDANGYDREGCDPHGYTDGPDGFANRKAEHEKEELRDALRAQARERAAVPLRHWERCNGEMPAGKPGRPGQHYWRQKFSGSVECRYCGILKTMN
eukprot:COSAG06_NODE_19828_length_820_cov_1.685160_2_plen_108_part_00